MCAAPRQLALALAPPPAPSYENFFAGSAPSNHAALAALREIATAAPRERFVYLSGPPGVGKTHLLAASVAANATIEIADDVECLDDAAQIALFDRYNRLRASGGRLVAAGSVPPAALPLRDDLRSRLAWGLAFELAPLADEERLAVLHDHARDRGLRVADELFDYIARRVRRDLGTQIAVLDALDRLSLESKRALTVPLAREVLATFDPPHQESFQ